MKMLILILCLAAPAAWAVETPTAPDRAELQQMLDEFLSGASANDLAAHVRFWADDLIYTSSRGTRFGKDEILAALRVPEDEEDALLPTYYAENVRIQQYGDTAVVAFRLVGVTPDEAGGAPSVENFFNTGTFLRREGRWQVVAWQATRIPED